MQRSICIGVILDVETVTTSLLCLNKKRFSLHCKESESSEVQYRSYGHGRNKLAEVGDLRFLECRYHHLILFCVLNFEIVAFLRFSWLIDFLRRNETSSLRVEPIKLRDIIPCTWMRKLMRMQILRACAVERCVALTTQVARMIRVSRPYWSRRVSVSISVLRPEFLHFSLAENRSQTVLRP